MPSTVSSYIYTFVALIAISTILVATLNSSTVALRSTSEREQLRNLLNYVAAEGNEILALTAATNSTTHVFLRLPAAIGYQQYWMRVCNDSSRAWLEGSLGRLTENAAMYQVFFPRMISMSGYFMGGYGSAVLESYLNGSTLQLKLGSIGG